MSKHTCSADLFSLKSINKLREDLVAYKQDFNSKCKEVVSRLADIGIQVGQANVGNFGKYITFTKELKQVDGEWVALMVATNTGYITSTWITLDDSGKEIQKSADVNPLLMVEFGSGFKAKNPKGVSGVGQGTFPNQEHAFDTEGWHWKDTEGVWHSSTGIEPKQPMIKAMEQMTEQIQRVVQEVFS